jgi:hypothetical protein
MWLLLAGCGDNPADPPDTGTPPVDTGPLVCPPFSVALGTGDTAYAPLADGDDVVIVHGFQGLNAFHLDVAGRVTGDVGSVDVAITVERLATGDVAVEPGDPGATGSIAIAPADACSGDFWGFRAIFDTSLPWVDSPGVCALDGERFRVAIDVTDLATGDAASDAVEVVVHPMPLDPDYDAWSWDCDNCPVDPNPDQADSDADGIGDACEPTGS